MSTLLQFLTHQRVFFKKQIAQFIDLPNVQCLSWLCNVWGNNLCTFISSVSVFCNKSLNMSQKLSFHLLVSSQYDVCLKWRMHLLDFIIILLSAVDRCNYWNLTLKIKIHFLIRSKTYNSMIIAQFGKCSNATTTSVLLLLFLLILLSK